MTKLSLHAMAAPNSDAVQSIIDTIDEILKILRDDTSLPIGQRNAVEDIYGLYHTSVRTDILNVLLPTLHRLRKRITDGDVQYFASEQFLEGVTGAVKKRCEEVVSQGRMTEQAMSKVVPALRPILEAIRCTATNYISNTSPTFEIMITKMTKVLDEMPKS